MRDFVHNAHPSRVIFGEGTMSKVAEEVRRLGAKRALVICTPGQRHLADRVAGRLNAPAAASAMSQLGDLFEGVDAATSIQRLVRQLGGPTSLAQLGLTHDDTEPCVRLATASPYPNPRPVTADGVRDVLIAALDGADVSQSRRLP